MSIGEQSAAVTKDVATRWASADGSSECQAPAREWVRPPRFRVAEEPAPGRLTRLYHRLEAKISRLSTKNNFWHRLCSWIWLPLAFRSGIKLAKVSDDAAGFSVMLPFRRFNRNWYNAMAGAALLANSEVAGGMYIFGRCGGDYTVVCKHLDYKFLRPCVGPALYRVEPRDDIADKLSPGGEFNITVDMHIVQIVHSADEKERRVGTCTATYHVTPKTQARRRRTRRLERQRSA